MLGIRHFLAIYLEDYDTLKPCDTLPLASTFGQSTTLFAYHSLPLDTVVVKMGFLNCVEDYKALLSQRVDAYDSCVVYNGEDSWKLRMSLSTGIFCNCRLQAYLTTNNRS